jgi:hypothetical protein
MNGTVLFEETQSFSPWLYAIAGLVLATLAGVMAMRQTTNVTSDAVNVRFGFLYRTAIPLSEVRQAEAVVYRPIAHYGGWGIRGFGKKRALNSRGNRGVLLTKSDGSTMLIGSQRPRELLEALARVGVPTQDKLPATVREF